MFVTFGAIQPEIVAGVSLFTNPVTVTSNLGVCLLYVIVSPAYVAVNVAGLIVNVLEIVPE